MNAAERRAVAVARRTEPEKAWSPGLATDSPAGNGAAAPGVEGMKDDVSHDPSLPPKVKRRRRRLAARAGLLLVLIASLFAVRLAAAPLEIPSADRIAHRILADLAGADGSVSIEAVALALEWRRGFTLVVDDMTLTGPAGSVSAPRTTVDVSLLSLLAGNVAVREIAIEQPVVRLSRPTFSGGALPGPIALLTLAEERLARLGDVAAGWHFERFSVANGRIDIPTSDPRLPSRSLGGFDVTADLGDPHSVRIDVSGRRNDNWHLALERRLTDEGVRLTLDGSGLAVTEFLPIRQIESGFRLSPTLTADFTDADEPVSASMQLGIGPGVLKIARDPRRKVDRIEVAIDWSSEDNRFLVQPSTFDAGDNHVVVTGEILPPAAPGATWRYRLESEGARLMPDDMGKPPLTLSAFEIEGAFDPERSYLTFDRAEARTSTGRLLAVGSLDLGPAGPTLAAALSISPTTVGTLMRLWPPVTAYDARKWVVNSVPHGVIDSAEMVFALTREDLDGDPDTNNIIKGGIDIDVRFSDAGLRLPGELPPMVEGRGTARVEDRRVTLDVESAAIDAPGGGRVAVDGFRAIVPDVTDRPPKARLYARVRGEAPVVASVAAMKPINALARLDLAPSDLTGEIAAELTAEGVIAPPIDPGAMEWSVIATTANLTSKAPIGGQTISDADVTLTATPRMVQIAGNAKISGIAAEVNYTERFRGEDKGQPNTTASFVLTDEERKQRGWNFDEFLTGPVAVKVDDPGNGKRIITADLEKARLALPAIGWSKAAGVPAAATAQVTETPEGIAVDEFELSADGVDIRGTVALTPKGELVSAKLDHFALRPDDSATAEIARLSQGRYRIRLEADTFDGRAFIRSLREKGAGRGTGPPIEIDARIGRLRGFNSTVLSRVTVAARMAEGRIERLDLAGSTGDSGGGKVVLAIGTKDGARRLTGTAGDAGRLLRFLDLYGRMRGGRAELDVALAGEQNASGFFDIHDFEIAEDPKLKEIIERTRQVLPGDLSTLGNPRPLAFQPAGEAVDSNTFERLSVAFTRAGEDVEISEAVLKGPLVGGAASGRLDLGDSTVHLTGTFIPAYAINNLFGRMPLVGGILGAGKSGGLLGVTFKLEGPLADPRLAFNPISVITPGIFRKIFEFR